MDAERLAGLVDQARKSDMDFGLMLDLLRQEISILGDDVDKVIAEASAAPVEAELPVEPASCAPVASVPAEPVPASAVSVPV